MDRSAAATHLPGHRRKRSGCRLDPASLELYYWDDSTIEGLRL
jgi:hypothetical protein